MARKRNWTEDEIEFLSANWGLKTVPGIAKCLNRTENAVELKAKN